MTNVSMRSGQVDGTRPPPRTLDGYMIIPLLAIGYAAIAFPLILASCSPTDATCLLESRPESRIFWPVLAAVSIFMAVRNFPRLAFPPHLVCLWAYLAFAGASVLWAFKPEMSFIRFAQQAMIVVSIVLPIMLAARSADMLRGLFACFAIAAILNIFFVLGRPPIDVKFATWGYPGYFAGKNYLGQFAAIAFLLSFAEMRCPGWRRAAGVVVAAVAMLLLVLSNSKTALGLVLLVPLLAYLTLLIRRKTRVSAAIILLSIPFCYMVFAFVSGIHVNRLSYMLYGDSTFTGRTIIWDFVSTEIARRPVAGWGYQSFWLVGPDAPSILRAPGWVKTMPNAHNGYLDTMVELGYVGFALLLTFIVATIHAIGQVAQKYPARANVLLSIALFIILQNFLESIWMRGFEFLWIVFLLVAAEAGRLWRHAPQPAPARETRVLNPAPKPPPLALRSGSPGRS
jgi:exopolysaccharide production protein ExoQ